MEKKYDYLVIGSGPAGYVSAIKASQLGLKVLVVEKEKDKFGGVCLNEGCIPAKSLLQSAKIVNMVKKNEDLFGSFEVLKENVLSGMISKSIEAREKLTKGLAYLFKKNDIGIIFGKARFKNKKTVSISEDGGGETEVEAGKILIATGSEPSGLSGINIDGESILTSTHAIKLDNTPKSILIIGSGAIGMEFASFYNILGTKVTIVEIEDTILPREDSEVSSQMKFIYKKRGVEVLTGCSVKEAYKEKENIKVVLRVNEEERDASFDKVLVATGRIPVTSGLGLEDIGIKMDDKGFIQVDASMQTNIKNIFAAGDVLNTPMLAHVAYAEGERAAESAAEKKPEPMDYQSVPNVIYSDIRVASIGLTEDALKEKHVEYKAGKYFFKANGRAMTDLETEGFIKILADSRSHKILGAHIVGYMADELIHELSLAKRAGLKVEELANMVHAHPTYSEAISEAARAVFASPIHG